MNNGDSWGAPPPAEGGIGHNSGDAWGVPAEAEAAAPVVKYEVKYKGQPDTEEPETWRLRRNAEIEHWLAAKPVLENAKTNEMDLRTKVLATLFPSPKKGTQRYELGGGFQVKLVYGLTYTLGNKEAVDAEEKPIAIERQVRDLEDKVIAEHGDAGEQILKRLIKWKPELSGAEYEKLDEDVPLELAVRNAIAEILTVKPASPQLTFEEPKAK